ncbi:hypothetical protein [Pseudobutyrivibrio sp.]|uniref:hypothetical protein n=1 Tax=Pseudobutyrivibrio sp. TaxID=2014367 RepID=UPI0025DEC4DB|nr:hypothetical protein [Pseudobutyrivibrio sp.]
MKSSVVLAENIAYGNTVGSSSSVGIGASVTITSSVVVGTSVISGVGVITGSSDSYATTFTATGATGADSIPSAIRPNVYV